VRNASELRPYQQRIATHLYENSEALCVVRPGGGKTAAALMAITEMLRDEVIRQALIIAPKRVARSVWPEEIAAWAYTQDLSYALVVGTASQREYILRQGALYADLIIVGIDVVDWLIDQLVRYGPTEPIFDLLVIDEISKLRNPTGVRAKLLAKHAHRWRNIWGLSGTLRPSSSLDLFMPTRVITRGKLWGRSYYQWRQNHFYPTDYKGYVWEPKPHAEEQINSEIAPLTVTLREDEYPQLPELTILVDKVELPPPARRAYDSMHRRLMMQLDDKNILAITAAVATGKLAQIANGFVYNEPKTETIALHDEKRAWLEDLIQDVEGPLLLVYEFLEDLRMIQEVCGPMPYLGHNVTDAGSDAAIRAWNSGKLRFMAMHPASGGHGLNLQAGGADMAWISPPWSPEHWEQSIARLHRPGQGRHVMVRVCAAANTVDEMKIARVQNKMSAQQAFEQYLRTWSQNENAR
jgi:hypothetical protein